MGTRSWGGLGTVVQGHLCCAESTRGSTYSRARSHPGKEQMTLAGPAWRPYVLAVMPKIVITSLAVSALVLLFCCSGFPQAGPGRIQLEWSLIDWG